MFGTLILLLRGAGTAAGSAPQLSPIRDRDILSAVAEQVRALDIFAAVQTYGTRPDGGVGSDSYPLCIVRPVSWSQRPEGSPFATVRHVRFVLDIELREDDEFAAYEAIDRLQATLANGLHGSDLGGIALPEHTLLTSGRIENGSAPLWAVEIQGQSAYLWQAATGLSTVA